MIARGILRWTGKIALGAVGLLLVGGGATFGISESRMAKRFVEHGNR